MAFEVHVLRPQAQPFEQAHAGPVEQGDDEPHRADEFVEQGLDLAPGEHDGQAPGDPGLDDLVASREGDVQHLPEEEQECGLGLIPGGGYRDVPFDSQMRQERFDVGCPEFARVPITIEEHEAVYPVDVGLVGEMVRHPTEFWLFLALVLVVAGLEIALVLGYGMSCSTVGIILGLSVIFTPAAKRFMRPRFVMSSFAAAELNR